MTSFEVAAGFKDTPGARPETRQPVPDRAYRRAAVVVLGLPRPVEDLQAWELEALPGIGNHL